MDYSNINQLYWDAKVPVHTQSDFYDLKGFLAGKNMLKKPELKLLQSLQERKLLHLQCHFGLDSLSIARMGFEVTALDFSKSAISQAQEISQQSRVEATFICADVMQPPAELIGQFEVVFISYGALLWLPDMKAYFKHAASYLKPGGKLICAEFHPIQYTFSDSGEPFHYPYFNQGPIVENTSGTYANFDASISGTNISWNHSFADILSGVIVAGFSIQQIAEIDYLPYPCFAWLTQRAEDEYVYDSKNLPLAFTLLAEKK